MVKQVTTKGALQAAIDIVLLVMYGAAGVTGIMYASVLQDMTMWFFYGAGIFMIFTCLGLISKVTKPLENYDTKDVA
jgi:hypothetical protein